MATRRIVEINIEPQPLSHANVMRIAGYRRLALVKADDMAWDQAFVSSSGEKVLLRSAKIATVASMTALQRMAMEKTFDRILYVVDDRGSFGSTDDVDVFRSADFVALAPQLLA